MSKDEAVSKFLAERGCPQSVVKGGISGLISQWEDFVTTVEEGYELGLDDYLNDLDTRQLLADALASTPESLDKKLADQLQRVDEQFNALTAPIESCIWGNEVAEEESWSARFNPWYYRRPRQGNADFLAEISEALDDE